LASRELAGVSRAGRRRVGVDHVTVTASDLPASARFYDAALGALGLDRVAEFGDEQDADPAVETVAWGAGDDVVLWLVVGPVPTSGAHLCLRARTRAQVERFHAQAVAAGGTSHDAPRRWAIYRRGEFNAIVRDPDGNLVEAVAAE
jgi:catechol 2,3-dioxygenase-like lactoylglutathione lyase family enzyme